MFVANPKEGVFSNYIFGNTMYFVSLGVTQQTVNIKYNTMYIIIIKNI